MADGFQFGFCRRYRKRKNVSELSWGGPRPREACKLGWCIRVRCLLVGRKPKSRDRKAIWWDTTTELDMKTLTWT
jgi:hypothetical protein